jgi:hypothetical protein
MSAPNTRDQQALRDELSHRFRRCVHDRADTVDRALVRLVSDAMTATFSSEELTGLQCLVRPAWRYCEEGAMFVTLEDGTIVLGMDPRYLHEILEMEREHGSALFNAVYEVGYLLRHELWHVLLGHNYIPPEYQQHPHHLLAMEVAVNDGCLQLPTQGGPVYPFVSLTRMGLMSKAQAIANELNLPKDWIRDYELIIRVLEQLIQVDVLEIRVERCRCDGTEHDVLVVVDRLHRREYRYHRQELLQTDQTGREEVDQTLRDLLPHLGRHFQYDPSHLRMNYSPSGFAEGERILRPHAVVLPWQRLRRLLALDRRVGYNRRTWHLYPPDSQCLKGASTVKRDQIHIYIDSSSSLSDDDLSVLVGSARQSPYHVRIFYFSTEVTDHPHHGGTDYSCILRHLHRHVESGQALPRAIIVFTDGYAAPIRVPYPERWFWVVLDDGRVPRQCGGHILKVIQR